MRDLTRLALAISQTDLERRLEVRGLDEVGRLAQAFNAMLDRLQAAFVRQQRFIADASHELRTPLAVLSGYISLLQRWGNDDEAVRQEALQTLEQETRRMQRLVADLLFLAKGQQGLQVRRRYFDLADLVAETVRSCQALDGGERVRDESAGLAPVEADWDLVRQMLWILIDNALKFSKPPAPVRVQARRDAETASLRVADEGQGAREGAGLGLAIAREIAAAHRAEIKVRSAPGVGTAVEVRFPPQPL